jgi:hypothetical protein
MIMVSGLTIFNASSTPGANRYRQIRYGRCCRRSVAVALYVAARKVDGEASSSLLAPTLRDPNNPINANQTRLQTSLINEASRDPTSLARRIEFPTMTGPNVPQMNNRIRQSLLRCAGVSLLRRSGARGAAL